MLTLISVDAGPTGQHLLRSAVHVDNIHIQYLFVFVCRLKTTTEYLDRRDEFQQREATLEAAAARHSWIRHMYTVAQVLAVCGLLCACLCVSVIFLANSYPRVLGLPGPEKITADAPALTDSDVGTNTLSAPHAVPRLGSESAARLQQADPSTSPVSGTIAPLTAPSSVAKSAVAATGTSQAVPTTVEYAAVSERTGCLLYTSPSPRD